MAKIVTLPAGSAVDLYAAISATPGAQLRVISLSEGVVKLFSTAGAPGPSSFYEPLRPGGALDNNYGADGAWALSASEAQIAVLPVSAAGWRPGDGVLPETILRGEAAVNVQFYDESNRKLGSQWGASRRITGATNGQKFYSIIKTRTLPVDLKARVFSYTGAGVIGRFYSGFTPQALPTPEPVYSLRPALPAFRDFDLYALSAAPVSLGTKWSYDLVLEGNAQAQGKGAVNAPAGQGWVIDPNKEILLEIESLDAQTISATLAMFNGVLDLPVQ